MVEHIPYFKAVAAAVGLLLSAHSFSAEGLSEEDLAIIERGQAIIEQTRAQSSPLLPDSPQMMQEAQQEAMELYEQIRKSGRLNQSVVGQTGSDKEEADHNVLIFASLSLGKVGLQDIFQVATGNPDTVVVFRGIPEGMNLGEGILQMQNIAKEFDPPPNIVINPTLFKEHNVTSVPTIVLMGLPAQPEIDDAIKSERGYYAKVSGLSNPDWLIREASSGREGDLGTRGPVEEISEPDLIEEAQRRAMAIDWDNKKEQAKARFWDNQNFHSFPRAVATQTRRIDPSVYLTNDITTPGGQIVARQGDVINPLEIRPFTQAVIVFDPLDKAQLESIQDLLPDLRKEPGVRKLTFVATQFDKEDGWKSYRSITDYFDAPVFLLTPDLINRFDIQRVPSIITASGKEFLVREIAGGGS